MLLLRCISQSCISSLQDSLTILTRRKTPENELLFASAPSTPSPQSSTAIINTSNKQSSQSSSSSTSGKSSLTVGLSSQSNLYNSQNKTTSLSGLNQQYETSRNMKSDGSNLNRLSQSSQ